MHRRHERREDATAAAFAIARILYLIYLSLSIYLSIKGKIR